VNTAFVFMSPAYNVCYYVSLSKGIKTLIAS